VARRLLVVGASHAGVAAATAARDAGWDGEVTLISGESRPPYQRPPLSKEALAGGDPAPLGVLDGIVLRLGVRALGLDAAARRLRTSDGDLPYDALVLATGAAPRQLDAGPEALTLREYDDALRLAARLEAARRLVVVGAGFIGAEVASAARVRGVEVTLLEQAELPLAGVLGRRIAAQLCGLHGAAGTVLRTGVVVRGLARRDGRLHGVELADGEVVPADVVVAALGVVADSGWLAGSGIDLGPDGSVRCDDRLRTSVPDVWAAGDLARVDDAGCGHVLTAAEQGRVAGLNAAGGAERWRPNPFAWSQWYGRRLQMAGTLTGGTELVVEGDAEHGLLGLARSEDRLVGVVGLDRPRQVAALRRSLGAEGSWAAALDVVSAPGR
jgi:NADPH-dependent 2,4-dienoyl-CoA reductase/sulfur reductase-like enzyme